MLVLSQYLPVTLSAIPVRPSVLEYHPSMSQYIPVPPPESPSRSPGHPHPSQYNPVPSHSHSPPPPPQQVTPGVPLLSLGGSATSRLVGILGGCWGGLWIMGGPGNAREDRGYWGALGILGGTHTGNTAEDCGYWGGAVRDTRRAQGIVGDTGNTSVHVTGDTGSGGDQLGVLDVG